MPADGGAALGSATGTGATTGADGMPADGGVAFGSAPSTVATTGTDGKDNILDLQPRTIHDRTQVFLGSTAEIQELHKYTGHKLKESPLSK